jgi:hypothetical protein
MISGQMAIRKRHSSLFIRDTLLTKQATYGIVRQIGTTPKPWPGFLGVYRGAAAGHFPEDSRKETIIL